MNFKSFDKMDSPTSYVQTTVVEGAPIISLNIRTILQSVLLQKSTTIS